jgi:hypothetical protein
MMIAPRLLVLFVALLCFAPHAEAGQMRSKHQRQESSVDFYIFGFTNSPPKCRPLLKQAIEIATPDPLLERLLRLHRILVSEQRLMLARY